MDFLAHMAVTWMMIASQNQQSHLVGGFNPFEKCSSNWIISPGKVDNKKYLKPPPSHLILQVRDLLHQVILGENYAVESGNFTVPQC